MGNASGERWFRFCDFLGICEILYNVEEEEAPTDSVTGLRIKRT